MLRRGTSQFGSPSEASASFPVAIGGHKAHPHFSAHLNLVHLWSRLASFFLFFFFWLPLICGHSVTTSCRPAGLSPLYRSCSLQPQPFQKNQDVMEYLLFDCLTTSENLSNSRKTPRNVEPEEGKLCQNQLLFISFGLQKLEPKKSWDNEVYGGFN